MGGWMGKLRILPSRKNWGLGMGWWRLGPLPLQAKVVDVVGANNTFLDVLKYFFSRK